MTMTLIETVTLTSSASSIEFTSIPQDGVDLLLVLSARGNVAGVTGNVQFNNSSSNYSGIRLLGNGSTASSASETSIIMGIASSAYTANTFASSELYISNYASSAAKSVSLNSVTENNDTAAQQRITAYLWNDTSAITQIDIDHPSSNFVAGSTASLYKIS